MVFESKALGEVTATNLRQLVEAGVEEHLHLEYKQELYDNNHNGRRECLQDICMFANAEGGVLIIGVPERRDANGQPAGTPDPNGNLGIEIENPAAILQSYDARVISCIQDRLPLESVPIPVGGNRHVLVFRVPNGLSKPYRVWFDGHAYFPSRRERQRYEMDVKEIKELTMRVASRLESAEQLLTNAVYTGFGPQDRILLAVGLVPIFSNNFMVDIKNQAIVRGMREFDLSLDNQTRHSHPTYTFKGLERSVRDGQTVVTLGRNGLLVARIAIGRIMDEPNPIILENARVLDVLLRKFLIRAQALFAHADISPCLLSMRIHSSRNIRGYYDHGDQPEINGGDYPFPCVQVESLQHPPEQMIRPLCDHFHQMFGRWGSPCFNEDETWNPPPFG